MISTKTTNLCVNPAYIVLGSGGHTAEMCTISTALLSADKDMQIYNPLRFLIAQDDTTSRSKITSTMQKVGVALDETSFVYVPRARKVGQSMINSIFPTIYAILHALWIIYKDQPKMILCNGPGTCVPYCLAVYFWRLSRRLPRNTKIVFVESWCRVRTLSLSARLLRPFVDLLVVQWPALATIYKNDSKVKYFGPIM
ncbi:uncharacterized protein Alg14 [Eurosta solidaginis]|uniref:uncharacterized protein Alg14 n=1 Tax=Eurosta solidaginis TaxID=178769 RepID=UPI0035309C91